MKAGNIFKLAVTEAELHLENTLLNGQCFNWWKATAADNKSVFFGVYRTNFVSMQRLSDAEVEVTVRTPADTMDDA